MAQRIRLFKDTSQGLGQRLVSEHSPGTSRTALTHRIRPTGTSSWMFRRSGREVLAWPAQHRLRRGPSPQSQRLLISPSPAAYIRIASIPPVERFFGSTREPVRPRTQRAVHEPCRARPAHDEAEDEDLGRVPLQALSRGLRHAAERALDGTEAGPEPHAFLMQEPDSLLAQLEPKWTSYVPPTIAPSPRCCQGPPSRLQFSAAKPSTPPDSYGDSTSQRSVSPSFGSSTRRLGS